MSTQTIYFMIFMRHHTYYIRTTFRLYLKFVHFVSYLFDHQKQSQSIKINSLISLMWSCRNLIPAVTRYHIEAERRCDENITAILFYDVAYEMRMENDYRSLN